MFVALCRFVGADMWVLYKNGQDALEALELDQQQVRKVMLTIHLRVGSISQTCSLFICVLELSPSEMG